MKYYRRTLTALAAILVAQLMAGAPMMAQAEDPSAYGDDYQVGNFGRVQYQENGVTILRAPSNFEGQAVEEALVNAPVFPGDTIVTGYDQRAETQLARGTLVRIDNGTEVTFQALPDPYADFPDNSILQLAEGTIQVSAALEEEEEFRIDTPAATIYLLGDGEFRIDVNSNGRSQVVSHRGVAEVVGSGGSVIVRGGMLAEVYPDTVPYQPVPFNTFASDGFDRWVNERDAIYRTRDRYAGSYEDSGVVYSELPNEVRPYYRELNNYGSWSYVADYGHVWHPTGVSASWRPYYDGYWRYGRHGYFWVSREPWGWAPYHYGRWSHVSGVGWCWIPGRVFGGAWVAWSWGSAYVGWAPLGYWNRPVYVNSLYHNYYDPYSWTFVGYKHFHHRHYRRHAVNVNHIRDHLKRHAVVTRPPRVSPRRLAESDEHRRRALRQVGEDEQARVRPIVKDRRPERTVRNLEEGMTRRRAVKPPSQRFDAADRRSQPDRASRGERGVIPSDGGRDKTTGRKGRTMPTYPRRLTAEDEDLKRTTGRQPAARSKTRTGSAGAPRRTIGREQGNTGRTPQTPRVRPRQTETGDSSERVRDLYRKAASPRTTRERTTPPRENRGTERAAPPKTTPAPRRTTPTRAQPRSGSSSRDTSKARTPARNSGSSQPKASPRRSSGSGGSKSSGASRGGSRSGGSKSSGASRGGSRSGGSKSSGSSSRGGSRSGGSKSSGGKKGKK